MDTTKECRFVDISRISMSSVHRKSGQAHGDVFGSLGFGRTVLHPFAGMRDDSLTRRNIENAISVCDSEDSFQYKRVLLEIRRLPRLDPASRTLQISYADLTVAGTNLTDVLVNQDRLVCHRFNAGWRGDQCWHKAPSDEVLVR